MRRGATREWFLTAGVVGVALLCGGCLPETFSRIEVGATDRAGVREILGPAAVSASEGYSLDEHQAWPTVIGLTHAAVGEGDSVGWKLSLQGNVVHLIVFQMLTVDLVYDGPLSEGLLEKLRAPETDDASEFRASLVEFVRSRVGAAMTSRWTDAASLGEDRYRSRFVGLLESTLLELRGRGTLTRDRFDARLSTGANSLSVRYLGQGMYRVGLRGGVALSPLPVL